MTKVTVTFHRYKDEQGYSTYALSEGDGETLGHLLIDCRDHTVYFMNHDTLPAGAIGGSNMTEYELTNGTCVITPLYADKQVTLSLVELRKITQKWLDFINVKNTMQETHKIPVLAINNVEND